MSARVQADFSVPMYHRCGRLEDRSLHTRCFWLTLSHCEWVVAVPRFPLGSRTLERVHSGTYATLVSGTTWQRIHRERALYLRSRRLRRTPLASWKRPRGISPSHVTLFLWYLMHPQKVRRRLWILNRVASSPRASEATTTESAPILRRLATASIIVKLK